MIRCYKAKFFIKTYFVGHLSRKNVRSARPFEIVHRNISRYCYRYQKHKDENVFKILDHDKQLDLGSSISETHQKGISFRDVLEEPDPHGVFGNPYKNFLLRFHFHNFSKIAIWNVLNPPHLF